MTAILFHTPHPNDGRDPYGLLPAEAMDFLHDLDGTEIPKSYLRYVAVELLGECGPDFQADIYHNCLSVTQVSKTGTPLHHWRAIYFKELPDANTNQTPEATQESQTEHGDVPAVQ